jgi:Ca2+-binding RTX toxin-like protein
VTVAEEQHMVIVNGTAGTDFIHRAGDGQLPPAGYVNLPSATTGADTINGFGGDDIIFADAGNDIINGGVGADAMTGGAGNDTYFVDNTSDSVVELAGEGIDKVNSLIDYVLGDEVENLTLTGTGNIDGVGNALDNVINGNAGHNDLTGGDGKDTIFAGAGNDILHIGAETEIAIGEVYNGGAGIDTLDGSTVGAAADLTEVTLSGLENLRGFNGGLTLTASQLDGFDGTIRTGEITISGAGVVDLSDANVQTATFNLSSVGNSLILNGVDNFTVNGDDGADTVTIIGAGSGTLNGNGGNDTLTGSIGNDSLTGGGGKDTVSGGAGDDTLIINVTAEIVAGEIYNGGFGDDTLNGNAVAAAANLTGVILNNLEDLSGFFGGVTLTAAQLDSFTGTINTGLITVSGAGSINLSDAFVQTSTVKLSNAGNSLTFNTNTFVSATINGGIAADTVTYVGAGGTTLNGNGGNDILTGGLGNDSLTGGGGKDTALGGAGDDILVINAQAEIVAGEIYNGGDGDDALDGSAVAAAANLTGVILNNLEDLSGFFGGVTLTAAQLDSFTGVINTGLITVSGAGSINLSDAFVETSTVKLSNAGNSLTFNTSTFASVTVNGGIAADTVTYVGTGSTTLNGNGGNDILTGSNGNDRLTGGGGKDTVLGGARDDTLIIAAQAEIVAGDIYNGGDGDDALDGSAFVSAANLTGVTLNNLEDLSGFSSGVTLTRAQLDSFTGTISTGTITVSGAGAINLSDAIVQTPTIKLSNAGNSLTFNGSGVTVNGGIAADTVTYVGTDGTTLNGNGGDDILTGSIGNDRLTGGSGKDMVLGGAGNDTLFINAQAEIVANEIYNGSVGDDTLDGSGFAAAANLTGVTLSNLEDLFGFSSGVTLTRAQLDSFTGSINTGTITVSGAGAINLSDAFVQTPIVKLSNAGNSLTFNGSGVTVNGGTAADTVTHVGGNSATLNGNGGNDTLTGGVGNDSLTGGAGKDTVLGGAGNDRLFINAQAEIVAGEIYNGGVGDDTLDGSGFAAAANLTGVTLSNLENLSGFSSGVTLTRAQLDSFTGVINTGAITVSGAGAINLSDAAVKTPSITLSDLGNSLVVNDSTSPSVTVNGGNAADNVTIVGGLVGSTINGNNGNDTMTGGSANDSLKGGAGNDILTGAAGSDQFIYSAAGNGSDLITDFSGQTAFGGGAGDGDHLTFESILHGTFSYRGNLAFTGTGNTEARVQSGAVRVDVDGNGAADFQIALTGLTSASQLVTADFLVS